MIFGMEEIPRWAEIWGPVVVVLGAMWKMTDRLEKRLEDRINRMGDRLKAVREAATPLSERVSRIEGKLESWPDASVDPQPQNPKGRATA